MFTRHILYIYGFIVMGVLISTTGCESIKNVPLGDLSFGFGLKTENKATLFFTHHVIVDKKCTHWKTTSQQQACHLVMNGIDVGKEIDHKEIDHLEHQFRMSSIFISFIVPANIPIDAIEYGLIKFVGIRANSPYLERMISGIQKGLRISEYGGVLLVYSDDDAATVLIGYHQQSCQLMFIMNFGIQFNNVTYAIDLSKVDVSIK